MKNVKDVKIYCMWRVWSSKDAKRTAATWQKVYVSQCRGKCHIKNVTTWRSVWKSNGVLSEIFLFISK